MFFFQVSTLNAAESRLFESKPTILETKAGIEKFQPFGRINSINSLAGGDVTKWNDVMKITQSQYIVKLLLNKTEHEFQKRYRELSEKEKG